MYKLVCKECNTPVANSNNVLGFHLRKIHKMEWVDYVIKHQCGGIHPTCACGCGEKLKWKKGGFVEFIRGHSSRGQLNGMFGLRGEQSPNYGKIRTDEHKKHYSVAAKKQWVENYQRKASANGREDLRKASSIRAIELLEQGKIGPQAPYKAEWKFNPFTNQEEYMHSSWESAFLDRCVNEDLRVTKKHDVRISYTDENGIERTYVPDFVAPDERVIYEIKGLETVTDGLKAEACVKWCKENEYRYNVVRDV